MTYQLKFDSPIHNLQVFLRTISGRYSDIPSVIPDGVYGEATEASVDAFKRKFMLGDGGDTDRSTWDEVVRVYKEILNEQTTKLITVYPENGLDYSNSNFTATVMIIQSMLKALAERFDNIPDVTVNGRIDGETTDSIKAVQIASGLNPDGNITPVFWNFLSAIYEMYVSVDRVGNLLQI